MKVLVRFLCCFIGSFISTWMMGCSNSNSPFNDVCISDLSSIVPQSVFKLEHNSRKDGVSTRNISSQCLNKHDMTNVNRYNYNYVNRGSYTPYCYRVQPGDTLFYIAWITGNDYRTLAEKNNIDVNSILKIGQILRVGHDKNNLHYIKEKNTEYNVMKNPNTFSFLNILKLDNIFSNNIIHQGFRFFNKNFVGLLFSQKKGTQSISSTHEKIHVGSNQSRIVTNRSSLIKKSGKEEIVNWSWPAYGKIISAFSSSEGGNKGIDIAGIAGQSIFSANSGKVVYAGDALFGYGNLIIIKHNNDFLSTYAHNDKILVVERQNVVRGQKIATMGKSGSDIVKLHFEIRYQGKSVDPLYYLPK